MTETKSLFKSGLKDEAMIVNFMDGSLYKWLIKTKKITSAERVYDIDRQKAGIDVVVEKDGNTLYIDEKATMYYTNARIPTFAFAALVAVVP